MNRIKYLFIFLSVLACTSLYSQSKKPVIVIVHGAWGGGWAFKKVDSLLTEKGAIVYRPTLTGQGERAHLANAAIGLNTHVEDIVNTILYEDLHDIVLVGHSYGGMVITGVADRVPERIRKIIYLDAFLPEDGESAISLRGGKIPDNLNGFMIPTWVKQGQKPPMDVPHSLKTWADPVSFKNPAAKKLDALYILTVDPGKKAEDDDFYDQSRRAAKKNWPVLQLAADHNAQWSAPLALAEMLYEAIPKK